MKNTTLTNLFIVKHYPILNNRGWQKYGPLTELKFSFLLSVILKFLMTYYTPALGVIFIGRPLLGRVTIVLKVVFLCTICLTGGVQTL